MRPALILCNRHTRADTRNVGLVGWALVAHAFIPQSHFRQPEIHLLLRVGNKCPLYGAQIQGKTPKPCSAASKAA